MENLPFHEIVLNEFYIAGKEIIQAQKAGSWALPQPDEK
jgi:hypothetical protein